MTSSGRASPKSGSVAWAGVLTELRPRPEVGVGGAEWFEGTESISRVGERSEGTGRGWVEVELRTKLRPRSGVGVVGAGRFEGTESTSGEERTGRGWVGGGEHSEPIFCTIQKGGGRGERRGREAGEAWYKPIYVT